MGMVINIQRYSVGDGPGVRTTVFLKGCPLRCRWCSNPESQSALPDLAWRSSLCLHCGRCVKNCPERCVSIDAGRISIDRSRCTRCGLCAGGCPAKALVVYGTEMSVDEVMAEVEKDRAFYEGSGGGMTLSGGEPLAQPAFARALLEAARERGIQSCIETTGMGDLAALLPLLDLVLFDVKAIDSELHRALTGVGNERIQESLAAAAKGPVPVIVRFPFIPGCNDSRQQIEATAARMEELGLKTVNLMPYHEYGKGKYESLDRPYETDSHKPTPESLQQAIAVFAARGIRCTISEK